MEPKVWFEMKSEIKKEYDKVVWVPLFATETLQKKGKYGYSGYIDESFEASSVLIPEEGFQYIDSLGWNNVSTRRVSRCYVDNGSYQSCDIMNSDVDSDISGIFPVLVQEIPNYSHDIWYIHQDIIIALGLVQEEDSWVAPDEDFIEVIKLTRDTDGFPIKIEMRNDFLKDYLSARKMGLFLSTYRDRKIVDDNEPEFGWSNGKVELREKLYSWRGLICPIRKGGVPFGGNILVIHTERTDVERDEDVPVLGLQTDENIKMRQTRYKNEGEKLFLVEGELWKKELILPGDTSERIRGDACPNLPYFIIDASGKQECKTTLINEGRWLWFKPDIINVLLRKRNGRLLWATKETGRVSCSSDHPVDFGINKIDLITVYAKHIVELPIWQQRIWVGYNVRPEGCISEEMYLAQIKATPVDTCAPESKIKSTYYNLNKEFNRKFNIDLFQKHCDIDLIFQQIQRFRSVDEDGLLALAKDISRVAIDSINTKELKAQMQKPDKEWGSLKTLQNFIVEKINVTSEEGYRLMTPFFGIYGLRLSDAHLKSPDLKDAYRCAGINRNDTPITQGYQLINSFMVAMDKIHELICNNQQHF